MRVVVDTNVVVSAVLSKTGSPRLILRLFLARQLDWLVNEFILEEYKEVLSRPIFGFRHSDIASLLNFIKSYSIDVPFIPQKILLPDTDDIPFFLCALHGHANALITGNKKHFPISVCRDVRIEAPSEFLERISKKRG